jgi:hypothetical protein
MDATAETQLLEAIDTAVKARLERTLASIGPCLLSAAMTAVPVFLQSFLSCIAGGGNGTAGSFTPGNRPRCG